MTFFERNHEENNDIVFTLMNQFDLTNELSKLTPDNFYSYIDAVINSTVPLENLRIDPAQVNNELIDYLKQYQYKDEILANLIAYTSNQKDYEKMSPFQKARLVVASISDTYNCHGKKMTNKDVNFGITELAKDIFRNQTEFKTYYKK